MGERLLAKPLIRGLRQVLSSVLQMVSPKLAVFYSSLSPSSQAYAHSQAHHLTLFGVDVNLVDVASMSHRQIAELVEQQISLGHYVSILRPLPDEIDYFRLLDLVPPWLDAEGVGWRTLAGLVAGDFHFGFPLTPWSAVMLPLSYGYRYAGRHVVVFGRSATVGMPLAVMLTRMDATVTVVHSQSRDVHRLARMADFVFVAVGRPGFLTPEMVSDGAIVVDIGYHPVGDGAVGDVSPEVYERVRAYTPVPGGVGALTTALVAARIWKLELARKKWDAF